MFFEERVAWVISLIKEKNSLTNVQIGEKLGIDKNTVAAYIHGKGDLKGVALAGIVKEFGINGEWLISGRGEPFPGAREKYKEVCGLATTPLYNNDTAAQQPPGDGAELKISDLLHKTAVVLESKSIFTQALRSNIEAFHYAITCESQLAEFRTIINKQNIQLADMQTQVNDLRDQVNRFTAPPTTAAQQEVG